MIQVYKRLKKMREKYVDTLAKLYEYATTVYSKRIYTQWYDTKEGSLGSVANFANLPYGYTPEVYGGICENECREVLTEFFREKRK